MVKNNSKIDSKIPLSALCQCLFVYVYLVLFDLIRIIWLPLYLINVLYSAWLFRILYFVRYPNNVLMILISHSPHGSLYIYES